VNLFFNAVSWLAILLVVAFLCFLVSFGLATLVVKLVPVLQRFFQVGIAVCCTVLTMFVMAGVILYLGARRT
jgi:hypothetical protein